MEVVALDSTWRMARQGRKKSWQGQVGGVVADLASRAETENIGSCLWTRFLDSILLALRSLCDLRG